MGGHVTLVQSSLSSYLVSLFIISSCSNFIYTMFGWEKKVRREKEMRKGMEREKEVRKIVDFWYCLVREKNERKRRERNDIIIWRTEIPLIKIKWIHYTKKKFKYIDNGEKGTTKFLPHSSQFCEEKKVWGPWVFFCLGTLSCTKRGKHALSSLSLSSLFLFKQTEC